jgi:hypothetical protein
VAELAAPLQVASDACQLMKSGTSTLVKVTKQLKAGDLNFCIARGCIRSLQDVLVTLMRHMSLLLKEIILRLDFWNDLHDSQWRIRVCLCFFSFFSVCGLAVLCLVSYKQSNIQAQMQLRSLL